MTGENKPGLDPNAKRKPWRPYLLAASSLALLAATEVLVCAQSQRPPIPETARPEGREGAWLEMHDLLLKRAQEGNIDLLFLGDSITRGWYDADAEGHGPREVWDRYYAPRKAANFGVGGDRTQHVLWRLDHGEVDGLKPKVVVLLLGTNNVGADTPDEVAEGIKAVLARLKARLPDSKVLLLGIFPRGKSPNATRDRIQAVNARLARMADGKTIIYRDVGPLFVNPDGTISQSLMPDFLHLSRRAYQLWADAVEPTLWEMLEGG